MIVIFSCFFDTPMVRVCSTGVSFFSMVIMSVRILMITLMDVGFHFPQHDPFSGIHHPGIRGNGGNFMHESVLKRHPDPEIDIRIGQIPDLGRGRRICGRAFSGCHQHIHHCQISGNLLNKIFLRHNADKTRSFSSAFRPSPVKKTSTKAHIMDFNRMVSPLQLRIPRLPKYLNRT